MILQDKLDNISSKIGINLYYSSKSTRTFKVNVGNQVVEQKYEDESNIKLKSDTLIFDSFIKKISYQVKPEISAVPGNPALPKKEQINIEKYYEMQFEVLSASKEEAIVNYKKLLYLINHLFYITYRPNGGKLDLTKTMKSKFGNIGIVFRGNPPISSKLAKGIVLSDKSGKIITNNIGKQYEAIIITETFNYDLDLDKGYVFCNVGKDFKDLLDSKIIAQDRDDEILVPLAFNISLMGTVTPDKFRGIKNKQYIDETSKKKEPRKVIVKSNINSPTITQPVVNNTNNTILYDNYLEYAKTSFSKPSMAKSELNETLFISKIQLLEKQGKGIQDIYSELPRIYFTSFKYDDALEEGAIPKGILEKFNNIEYSRYLTVQ